MRKFKIDFHSDAENNDDVFDYCGEEDLDVMLIQEWDGIEF